MWLSQVRWGLFLTLKIIIKTNYFVYWWRDTLANLRDTNLNAQWLYIGWRKAQRVIQLDIPRYKLGHHKWFALRHLITNSRHSARGFWNRFLKETSQVNRRTKNCAMKRLLHGTLYLRNSPTGEQIQNGRPTDEISRDNITSWCGPALFCFSFSVVEISVLKISQLSFTAVCWALY